jgi:PPOX class probable F420-dependent enzyme
MTMEMTHGLGFAAARSKGTLVTIRRDGRPQVSNVLYVIDDDVVTMSLTDDRAKTRNLRADPRACLHVTDESFWQYVVLDGVVDLSAAAEGPADETVELLVSYYRRLSGEHPDWDEYRAAMVSDRRLVASLKVTSVYGQVSA